MTGTFAVGDLVTLTISRPPGHQSAILRGEIIDRASNGEWRVKWTALENGLCWIKSVRTKDLVPFVIKFED